MFDLEQMNIEAEYLLARAFSNPPINLPSEPNHTPSPSVVPSTANKKSVIEDFVPKSLLIPERFEARSDLPSLDELMETDASVLRMTAKNKSKRSVSADDTTYFIGLQRI